MNDTVYKIKLANIIIEIEEPNAYLMDKCEAYFVDNGKPDIFIKKPTNKEISEEKERANRQRELDGLPTTELEQNYLEYINIYRKIADKMPEHGVMLMHAAAISVENKAYLFLAKSGTGKTTHIMNWLRLIPEAIVINGDKPLIDSNNMTVCGTPWAGKENYNTNISVPLAGICILERGEENEIFSISSWDALKCINNQTYWPLDSGARRKTLEIIDKLGKISCYRLFCTPDILSAKVAYEAMSRS